MSNRRKRDDISSFLAFIIYGNILMYVSFLNFYQDITGFDLYYIETNSGYNVKFIIDV